MPIPNTAPDYIPADVRDMYNLFVQEGKEDYILQLEEQYAPKPEAEIEELPEEFQIINERNIFDSSQVGKATPKPQGRDPFSSFANTPEKQAELRRTNDARMLIGSGQMEQKAIDDSEKFKAQQQEQALNKLLTGNPETFYDKVIAAGVVDPALLPALKKADRNIFNVLNEEETKAFRTRLLMDIDKGVDPFTAQQNAYVRVQEIKKAQRVPAGFTTPPVKKGDTKMTDPTFGQQRTPSLGEAFGRQTFKTEEQAAQEKLRLQEADRIKSQLYGMFANQAVGEFAKEGKRGTPQEVRERADQIEKNYVEGELLKNFVVQSRDDYLRATGLTMDDFRSNPEARKESRDLAEYLYNDFLFNVYPERGGAQPEEPSFLKEIMTETTDEGAIVESRTSQALRGLGGLIRPVTEAVSDVISYEVVTDPVTGEVTYPEGTPLPLQQPMNVTKERSEMSYGDLIASDVAQGRFLGEDYMQMPMLTNALGDENAAILGLVTEIGLPITPLGMVGPTLKGTAMGSSALAYTSRGTAKLLQKTGLDTAAKYVGKADATMTGAEKHLRRMAEIADQPVTEVANYAMKRKAASLRNDMNLTPEMFEVAQKKVVEELKALYAADVQDLAKIEKTQELLNDLQRTANDFSTIKPKDLPTSAEFGMSDALARVGAELKPEARAVFNDIMTTHKLMNEISNEAATGLRGLMDASSDSPYFRKVIQSTVMDIIEHGNFDEQAKAFEYLSKNTYMPDGEFSSIMGRYLANESILPRIKGKVIEDYIRDYTFNMLPENYIFISPKAVVSAEAYRKNAPRVFQETNEFIQTLKPEIVGDKIKITLTEDNLVDVTTRMRDNYGVIAKAPIYKKILNKLKEGTIELTQEEFNFVQSAIREQTFAEFAEGSLITPQRATQTAIERADVPLPRRKDLARLIRTTARNLFPEKMQTFFSNKSLGYTKASQYGLARALQQTEQEFSNFTIRLQQKAQRALAANGQDVEKAVNSMLLEAKAQMGYTTNRDMFYYMLKQTFDTQGISDDVLTSFVFARVSEDSLDLVGDFNKLYDEFLRAYPSKETSTLGGKIIERKNTAVTFVEAIAEGEKQAITRKIYTDMEQNFPDMFFKMPRIKVSAAIPEKFSPQTLQKTYQAAEQESLAIRALDPEAAAELRAGSTSPVPLSKAARGLQEADKAARFAAFDLNTSISRSVVKAISPDEVNQVALAEQKRYINAMISDLYEGGEEASKYALGELATEGQGFLGTNVARLLITPQNVRKVKAALQGVDEEYIRAYVGTVDDDFSVLAKAADIAEEDELFGMAILQSYRDGNFQALQEITGFKPVQLMHNLESVGFPKITTKYNFESLRPTLESINPEQAVLASTKDIEMLKALQEKSIEGTLGQSIDILSRKSDSLGSFALSSAGYAVVALNQSIKGGMLGGVLAPTGKYLSVNAVTAPFIMAYTAPSIMGATFTKLLKTGGAVVVNPLLAAFKTGAQAGYIPSSAMGSLGGAFAGGFAAGPVGAIAGAIGGGATGASFTMAGRYIEALIKAGGNGRITDILSTYKPEAAAIRTIDGRIFTQAEVKSMLERNNIMFSQVNFEFGQSAYNTMIRQMGINATGKQVGHIRNALRWLRPDRPNFWNTIALETDNAFRTQVFADALYLGYTEKQAAEFARRSLLDYSDMSKAEQKYIAQYFLFYSFMRQSFVEVAGAFAKGDPTSMRNIVAAARYGQEQKKIANTDELFIDESYKSKAMASVWTQLGKSYDETMTLHYGPAFPSTESFMQLANTYFFIYDSTFSDYQVQGGAVNELTNILILKGNPVLQQVLQQGSKKFRSENAPHGVVPVREVIALKSSGTFAMAESFFELEPIPKDEMSAGRPTYPVEGQDTNIQYRISSKKGSKRYLLFKIGLLTSGMDRGVQDWAATTSEKLELDGAKLKRYSDGNMYLEAVGLATPIAVPNYYVQRDRKIKQIVKELRAEQD